MQRIKSELIACTVDKETSDRLKEWWNKNITAFEVCRSVDQDLIELAGIDLVEKETFVAYQQLASALAEAKTGLSITESKSPFPCKLIRVQLLTLNA